MNRDLTVGKPENVLWKFCIPLFASVIFQQLYNIADSFVAGKFVGEDALAAVGNSYEITLIFIAFAFGCNIGCSVIVSRLFGAKLYSEMKTAVSTAMISTAVLCLVLISLGLLESEAMLKLIHTPEEILTESKIYLDIYIFSLFFVFFYNIANGIFSALGDSRTPFIFLMCSSIANIGADILFTTKLSYLFPYGVAAVAWATFMCQGVSCILSLIVVLLRMVSFRTDGRISLFSVRLLKEISAIAIPSMIQQSFISVGNIIIQRFINVFGTGVIAGYAAAIKLNNLVITSLTTLGNGISNYTAQNLGAKKTERIPQGFYAGRKMVWLICLPFTFLYFFAGDMLIRLFLDSPSDAALNTGILFLRIVAPFYFVVALKLVSDGILRGAGLMKPFMIGTFTDLILRVVLAGLLSMTKLGSAGIWLAWPVGWSIATILSVWFYRKGPWKTVGQM